MVTQTAAKLPRGKRAGSAAGVSGTPACTNRTAAARTARAGAAVAPACVLTAALTGGPYFVDEKLQRSDIRSDPSTGAVQAGVPLSLRFTVSRVANGACTPLTGAYLDVWHANPAGSYSDIASGGGGSPPGVPGRPAPCEASRSCADAVPTASKLALILQSGGATPRVMRPPT